MVSSLRVQVHAGACFYQYGAAWPRHMDYGAPLEGTTLISAESTEQQATNERGGKGNWAT